MIFRAPTVMLAGRRWAAERVRLVGHHSSHLTAIPLSPAVILVLAVVAAKYRRLTGSRHHHHQAAAATGAAQRNCSLRPPRRGDTCRRQRLTGGVDNYRRPIRAPRPTITPRTRPPHRVADTTPTTRSRRLYEHPTTHRRRTTGSCRVATVTVVGAAVLRPVAVQSLPPPSLVEFRVLRPGAIRRRPQAVRGEWRRRASPTLISGRPAVNR